MAFIPVPNTVLVELRMLADSQQVENTLWFEFDAPPTLGEMEDLADALLEWWNTYPAELMWSGVSLREIVVTDMTTNTGPQFTLPAPGSTNGQLSVTPLPTGVSLTISFRTVQRGRSFRGRNYIVGLVEDQMLGANEVLEATATSWAAAYTALLVVAADVSCRWVVVSRFSGVDSDGKPVPRVTGVTTEILSVVIVDNIVDSQRRRLPTRGN